MPPLSQSASETNTLKALSPGKLNLTFDILGDLPDGYHEVETLMQTVSIQDELTFSFNRAKNFSLQIDAIEFAKNKADVPVDQNNLIAKAAQLFHRTVCEKNDHLDTNYQISVRLKKSVPVAGGMGGGSGNAAATLVVFNNWFGSIFSKQELATMAAKLGADVPFFIDGGTQIGTHKGDTLTRVENSAKLSFLIVGPKLFGMSTPEVYRAYDEDKDGHSVRISADACATALASGNLDTIAKSFGNAFEPCVYARKPELKFIANRIKSIGGYCTRLTGSGPTLYVLTKNDAESESIQKSLRDEQVSGANGWSEWTDLKISCWIASSTNCGVTLAGNPKS
jgi:4-diphosphocytidyl-2-C-methyl-D-erythritol kinase